MKVKDFFIASSRNNYCPPVISYKAFIIYGLVFLLLRLLLSSASAQGAAVNSNTLMELINQEREQRNITVLFTNNSLLQAANVKSNDMIERDYFAHQNPDGEFVWPTIVSAGYTPYITLGENLAIDFSTSEGMVQAWLNSPSHRENLLNTDFVDQGLAALFGEYQTRFTNLTTSLFGTLAVKAVSPPPPPPPENTTPPTEEPVEEEPQIPPPPPPTEETPPPDEVVSPTAPDIDTTPEVEQIEPESTTTHPITAPTTRTPRSNLQVTESLKEIGAQIPNFGEFLQDVKEGRSTPEEVSRVVFTGFSLGFLLILAVNSAVILNQKKEELERSHASYHLLAFIILVLVSLIVWWWQ